MDPILASRLGTTFTYKDLKEFVNNMPDEQLDQSVQILPNNPTPAPIRLKPIYWIGKVGETEQQVRNIENFEHNPDQIVLLEDSSPYGEYGDTYYSVDEAGNLVGNKSGIVFKSCTKEILKKPENCIDPVQ